MKIIGMAEVSYNSRYICEVSHQELEKFMNLYYNKMQTLKCGEEVDLGKGYDFYHDTKCALEKTREFIESNGKVINAIINGVKLMATEDAEP